MKNLSCIAPINSLSYGILSYNFIVNLYDRGYKIALFPIGDIPEVQRADVINNSFYKMPNVIVDKYADCLRIWHQNELFEFVGKGRHIGFPIFELDTFDDLERKSLNNCDHIIVCSQWAKDIVEQNGITRPVSVVPLGYDETIFKPTPILGGATKFFNIGKWEYRKGHDFILDCFHKAFSSKDNVELIMMCENPFPFALGDKWEDTYRKSPMASKIKLIPRTAEHENVYYIMKQVDCGIFPSRAEGWNLGMLELMATGRHIITTNYSGHTEFCDNKSCNLIEIDSLESAVDNIWFNGKGNWAHLGKTQKNQCVDYMRDIHNRKQSGQLLQNQSGILQSSNFTWKKSTDKLVKVL